MLLGGKVSITVVRHLRLFPEEPDEVVPHVRICEGPDWVTVGPTRKLLIKHRQRYER